jgi:hypothetical protein
MCLAVLLYGACTYAHWEAVQPFVLLYSVGVFLCPADSVSEWPAGIITEGGHLGAVGREQYSSALLYSSSTATVCTANTAVHTVYCHDHEGCPWEAIHLSCCTGCMCSAVMMLTLCRRLHCIGWLA